MSYNAKTDRMDWKDEFSWLAIALVSGVLLSSVFIFFDRFPGVNNWVIFLICCAGFYLLSILVRIQNHRGKPLTGKTGAKEPYLKYIFPIFEFGVGFAILLIK